MKFLQLLQRRRRVVMGLVAASILVTAVSASQWGRGDGGIAAPAPRQYAAVSSHKLALGQDVPGGIALERLKRTGADTQAVDLFATKSWFVPPPPAPPPPPPAPAAATPPSAPPLPFTFLGKMQEPGAKLIIFLVNGERVLTVTEGEIIDNTYSVDGIEQGQMVLTYLPLKIKQYIDIGEKS